MLRSASLLVCLSAGMAAAQDPDREYGAYLAGECTTCHQLNGATDGIPTIIGLEGETFTLALHAYRDKTRDHPVMQMIAGRLTDRDIAALAAYFKDPEEGADN